MSNQLTQKKIKNHAETHIDIIKIVFKFTLFLEVKSIKPAVW